MVCQDPSNNILYARMIIEYLNLGRNLKQDIPVSSFNSLAAACISVSPTSIFPLGKSQCPALWSKNRILLLCTSKTLVVRIIPADFSSIKFLINDLYTIYSSNSSELIPSNLL